jgi:gliding motility-associated-like protein
LLTKRTIIAFLLVSSIGRLYAQEGGSNIEFVENKGQWDSRVLLKGVIANGSFYLKKDGFTVVLHNPEELARVSKSHVPARAATGKTDPGRMPDINRNEDEVLHSHAYAVHFEGMNEHIEIIPDKPLPGYNNYFVGDRSKWASNCKVYQGVTYKNVYPGIDLRYYTSNGHLKYDIIVHPGADAGRISLRYEGANGLSLKNNRLSVKTSVGDVSELEPYAYQTGPAGKEEVRCRYRLVNGNQVKFDVRQHDPASTLVIDPTLVFATFSGSQASNWGFTATPGPDGSFFAGGIVFGDGFPVTTGSYVNHFQGGTFDVGIIKISSNGQNRLYATYLGGSDIECPHSLFSDPQGNLVVMGRTYSKDFYLASKFGSGGGADMFVVKLNATGSGIIGSARIGGTKDDCVNMVDQLRGAAEKAQSLIRNYGDDSRSEVILDGSNNIYIAASTQSATPDDSLPITPGSFQPTFGGGIQDGYLVKLSPDCSKILFASYLGGSREDAAFVLKLNPSNGDIYVAGATASPDFPGNKTNVVQPAYAGGISDAYITIISNDGTVQKKTTFLGTPDFDAIYGIGFDKSGFPYIMGSTLGNWTVTPNVSFVNPGSKQFISKLQPDLSAWIYSTTFGTASKFPNISPVAFLVDRCENVYVSGWGGWLFAQEDPYGLAGTLGMPVSPGALKSITDGRDFYFIVIQKNAASMLYATFYGQQDGPMSVSEHVDGGTSRYDANGIIYQAICANCGGQSLTPFPTTPGVWSPKNGTGGRGCNLAAVKIAFNFAGVGADPRSLINGVYDSTGCIPLDVVFHDTVRNAKSYIWNFGDGSGDSATTSYHVEHIYNNVGVYKVRLIAIDSNTCNVRDTAYQDIYARTDKALLSFLSTKLAPCQSLSYQFDNTSVPPPAKPFSPTSFTWDFGDGTRLPGSNTINHSFLSAGTYNVQLILNDTSYCNYPDSISKTLRVSPLVKASFQVPNGCAPYNAVFNNTTLAGQQFFWDFGDGNLSNDINPSHLYPDTGNYTVRLVVIDSSTCNIIDSTKQTISVHSKPTAAFTVQPVPPQPNTPNVFFNNATGAVRYQWFFGDGDSVLKNNQDTTIHQYQLTGTFQACLVAFNEFECPDTACHPVTVQINPLLDVPNAFTPGRFGQNSIIYVHGYGIISMDWRIYNRWGQKVFESNNPSLGWDGNSNGVGQPMDVYTYTLEASFEDGTKTTKVGDITLIR